MREPEKGPPMWRYVCRPLVSLVAVAACAGGQAAMAAGGASRLAGARAGVNLLGNPGAQAGDPSGHGWDSVTIPGWQVVAGLPTVVRYGTAGFPRVTGQFPARRGGQLFSGGVGGTAVLGQQLALRSPGGGPLRPGTRFRLSGWLGGTRSSRASVTVWFRSAAGRLLGRLTIGPVGLTGPAGRPGLVHRQATGTVPRGTTSARVTLRLGTLAARSGRAARRAGGLQPRGRRRAAAERRRRRQAARAGPAAGRARAALPARIPVLLRESGLRIADRRHQAGALPEQPAPVGQPAGEHLRRGASQRRQLPGHGRRQHVRRAADQSARGEPALHDPRSQHRRPARRRARDLEGLPAERQRPVRRHRARLVLERRPAAAVLRPDQEPARVLRQARRAARGRCGPT